MPCIFLCKAFFISFEAFKKYGTLFITKVRDVQTGNLSRQGQDGNRFFITL